MNEHNRVAGRKNEGAFRLVLEKLIYGLPRSGAGREAVVIEHHECPIRHARVEVFAAVEDRPVKVEVNVCETDLLRKIVECLRYPAGMKNCRGNQCSNGFEAGVCEVADLMQVVLGIGI